MVVPTSPLSRKTLDGDKTFAFGNINDVYFGTRQHCIRNKKNNRKSKVRCTPNARKSQDAPSDD